MRGELMSWTEHETVCKRGFIDQRFVLREVIRAEDRFFVYRATDFYEAKAVELILVRSDPTGSAPPWEQTYERIAWLREPTIARVVACRRDGPQPYVVFESPRGAPLCDHATASPLTPDELLGLAEQLGRALAEIHRAGLVHDGVFEENIVVDDRSEAFRVRLRAMHRCRPVAAFHGSDHGPMGLVPLSNAPDPRDDLSCLSVLLRGHLDWMAFERRFGSETARRFTSFLERCASPDPAVRPTNGSEFVEGLRACWGEPTAAPDVTTSTEGRPTARPPRGATRSVPALPRTRPPRLAALAWCLAGGAVFACLGVLLLFLRRPPAQTEPGHESVSNESATVQQSEASSPVLAELLSSLAPDPEPNAPDIGAARDDAPMVIFVPDEAWAYGDDPVVELTAYARPEASEGLPDGPRPWQPRSIVVIRDGRAAPGAMHRERIELGRRPR